MESINTGKQDDLDVTIPGTGIALGGDGQDDKDGFPRIHIPGVYDGKTLCLSKMAIGHYQQVPR